MRQDNEEEDGVPVYDAYEDLPVRSPSTLWMLLIVLAVLVSVLLVWVWRERHHPSWKDSPYVSQVV